MFSPMEVNKQLPMNLTIIKLDQPTESFAAMFTSNKFPGGPVLVGKERMQKSKQLQAVVINNKISNVCPGGVDDRGAGDSEVVCQAVADSLQLQSKDLVFPSSTGIIGWRLPVQAIKDAVVSIYLFEKFTLYMVSSLSYIRHLSTADCSESDAEGLGTPSCPRHHHH
jgi:glutamate N-acetyltransferase/amino-acid N-acetyltransferase